MRKFPASLLLAFFLIISTGGFSQNSNPLPVAGKDSVKGASLPLAQEEKAKIPGDSSYPLTHHQPSAHGNKAGNTSKGKSHQIAMRKKQARKQIAGLPDTGEFIYDLNAFYSIGK